ncbi:hypothetical protein RJ640_018175 [Escallonia rubra]|uniref:Glycosyltransferase n=1 Tax=Escallonia rubra TaxID=112253 RepID=A0AA88UC53_9ASTE|nr:hypothetical protein RJ640_018175 [Escallonia rubra]
MKAAENGVHVLMFPYPAQGHLIPLLDLTHQLVIRNVTATILVTPENLPILNPLLSHHPSIRTLVLPFPTNPSIPSGIENVQSLPPDGFRTMIPTLGELYNTIFEWFRNHASPPVAIISDMFLGWTHHLACRLGIRRIMFTPCGAMGMSVIYSLWRELPKRDDPNDENEPVAFPNIPTSPVFPWWQLSPIYRSYVEGDPVSEFIKDGFHANMASWGLMLNSFNEMERVYLDHLMAELGHDRVWAVGPLLPDGDDLSKVTERGGPSSASASEIFSWLDKCEDQSVLYVSFGSQSVLRNDQMEELALALEKSGCKFIWVAKEATKGHEEGAYSRIPPGFEGRVAGRGLVLRGWVPQVPILSHRAVGASLNHCGWNSLLEGLVTGVPALAWPMGADNYTNATLMVDQLRVAIRACEGAETVPNGDELARLVRALLSDGKETETRARVMELSEQASGATKQGGTSYSNLDELVQQLQNLPAQ